MRRRMTVIGTGTGTGIGISTVNAIHGTSIIGTSGIMTIGRVGTTDLRNPSRSRFRRTRRVLLLPYLRTGSSRRCNRLRQVPSRSRLAHRRPLGRLYLSPPPPPPPLRRVQMRRALHRARRRLFRLLMLGCYSGSRALRWARECRIRARMRRVGEARGRR
jgi:hypothetical protein